MAKEPTIKELVQRIDDLQFQVNDREQEIISLRGEVSELREATSTLSTWMEKLAETVSIWMKKPK